MHMDFDTMVEILKHTRDHDHEEPGLERDSKDRQRRKMDPTISYHVRLLEPFVMGQGAQFPSYYGAVRVTRRGHELLAVLESPFGEEVLTIMEQRGLPLTLETVERVAAELVRLRTAEAVADGLKEQHDGD